MGHVRTNDGPQRHQGTKQHKETLLVLLSVLVSSWPIISPSKSTEDTTYKKGIR